ncbi:MAG: DUF4434 domain-containing protein [Thiomicrorhabdus sp.]|nr:DUF4434 domain-containing protein [Thiomicrorhabdus sp.]
MALDKNASPPALQGTFIQLLSHHNQWTEREWRELFSHFKKLQLSQVVVQWSVLDEMAFYRSKSYQNSSSPALQTILKLADEHQIKVLIGLAYNTEYWDKVQNQPSKLQSHFNGFYKQSFLAAKEILPLAIQHASFQGWYISEEIDDINWQSLDKQQILFRYLNRLTQHLRALTPSKKIALSGFSNAALTPQEFQRFWQALLVSADIDLVLFQDGIGVNKLQLDNLPSYFEALQTAAINTETELQGIIEIFTQVSGFPINNKPFKAVSAPLDRVIQQLRIAHQYTQKNIAFSIPEYMTPEGGAGANQLYQSYRKNVLNNSPLEH